MTTTLRTNRMDIALGDDPLAVETVTNRVLDRPVCTGGGQQLLVRLPQRLSEPVFLNEIVAYDDEDGVRVIQLADETGDFRARLQMTASAEGLHFALRVEAPEPLWMVEWALHGLELDEVIVPALGGQVLRHWMPAQTPLAYKYPFWWNAQFVVGTQGEGGGVWLGTKERAPHLQLLRVVKEDADRFALGLGFEAQAPLTEQTLAAEWTLDVYAGSWHVPVDRHRRWMEEAFDLVPRAQHPRRPAWVDDVDCVLEIWGMRKDRGEPAHTFAEMEERVRAFAELHAPERTLLYLPGFAEGGIDSSIPSYEPAPKCGGREGFQKLVATAHALGYRVMIHTNVLGMAYTHPRFPEFEQHQVVDVFDRPQGWAMDADGDWLAEPYFAYIHPGAVAWGDLMQDVLGELVESFDLDAVFLDQTLLAFNVSRGGDFLAGMRRHVERLQAAYPDVLFAGEGLHEQVLTALPVAQVHGLDSITGVHGMVDSAAELHGPAGQPPWRAAHPVSSYLFGRYTHILPHLLTKHPSHPLHALQERAYDALGILPALVLYDRHDSVDTPAVRQVLKRAGQTHATLATAEPIPDRDP